MLIRSPELQTVTTSENNEASVARLQLAIFDLGSQAFASLKFDIPTLIEDTLDETPATPAKRIETFHNRHPLLNLPPLKNMGFIFTEEENLTIAAVKPVHERGIKFRDFVLRQYPIQELHEHVQQLNAEGLGTPDTEAINVAYSTLPELKRYRHIPSPQ